MIGTEAFNNFCYAMMRFKSEDSIDSAPLSSLGESLVQKIEELDASVPLDVWSEKIRPLFMELSYENKRAVLAKMTSTLKVAAPRCLNEDDLLDDTKGWKKDLDSWANNVDTQSTIARVSKFYQVIADEIPCLYSFHRPNPILMRQRLNVGDRLKDNRTGQLVVVDTVKECMCTRCESRVFLIEEGTLTRENLPRRRSESWTSKRFFRNYSRVSCAKKTT